MYSTLLEWHVTDKEVPITAALSKTLQNLHHSQIKSLSLRLPVSTLREIKKYHTREVG